MRRRTLIKRPKIVLHAGFPKCGTSTLQKLFSMDGHHVSRSLGLVWIGRGIRLWSPHASAVEIMYDKEGTIERIDALDPDCTQIYFMSSEALCSNLYAMEALARKFDILRSVLTVRSPFPMVMSEYCWSGWLYRSPDQVWFRGRVEGLVRVAKEMSAFGPVSICPIEPAKFATRFCETVIGRALPDTEEIASKAGNVNVSIAPALAAALHREIRERGIGEIPGPMRGAFVNTAMNNKGLEVFHEVLPQPFIDVFGNEDLVDAEIRTYGALLAEGGLSDDLCDEAMRIGRERISVLAARPAPGPEIDAALRQHAQFILSEVARNHPSLMRQLSHPG